MSRYENAEDQYVVVNGTTFAYRRFGASSGIPLVLHIHFRGTMDHWDPALINPLAATRPIVLIDNAGIGRSGGEVPTSYSGWARHIIDVLYALDIKQIDLLGFSMGGCAAQLIALNAPGLVRRLILAGTTLSIGDGVVEADLGPFTKVRDAVTEEEQHRGFLETFFSPSERSQAAGEKSWRRITSARQNRANHLSVEGGHRQAASWGNFMDPKLAKDGTYDRLHELQIPVLVANGSDDVLIPTPNSYLLWKKLVNADAHLHLFPACGHGFLYEYADIFSRMISEFLDYNVQRDSRL